VTLLVPMLGKYALRHEIAPGRMTAAPASPPSATMRRGLCSAWPSFHSAASTTVPMPPIGSGRLLRYSRDLRFTWQMKAPPNIVSRSEKLM
jgi:hypothetical protein